MASNTLAEFAFKIFADTKDLQQGLKEAESQTEKTTETLEKKSKSSTKIAENAFANLGKELKKLAVGFISLSATIGAFKAFRDFTTELDNTQQLLGGNVGDLAAMSRAMTRFGGDISSVKGALENMNSKMQEARFGGGALIEVARRYGVMISPYQKADKALLSLAKQMRGFSLETKRAIMNQLGLDEAMQRALLDGGAELEKQIQKQKLLGVETEADIQMVRDFNNAWLDLKDIFAALSRELMRAVVPILKGLVNVFYRFVELIRENKVFVTAFFIGVMLALTPILAILAKMAIATIIAFAPFIAIGAVIAAIAAIFEDLYYYFMGWDSATGQLVKKFPFLKKVIEPLRPIIVGLVNIFKKFINLITNPSMDGLKDLFSEVEGVFKGMIDAIFGYFESFFSWLGEKFPALKPLFDGFISVLSNVKDVIYKVWEAVKKFFSALFDLNLDGMIQAAKDALYAVLDLIKNVWSKVGEVISGGVKKAWSGVKNFFGFGDDEAASVANANAPQTPMPASVISNSGGNVTQNVNVNQTINSNDGKTVAAQAASALPSAMIGSVNSQRQIRANGLE